MQEICRMDLKNIIIQAIKACIPHGIIALHRHEHNKKEAFKRRQKLADELYGINVLKRRFLTKQPDGKLYFDFNGAYIPDISDDAGKMKTLMRIFSDTFMFPCLFNDNHDKSLVEIMDLYMKEGPYGFTDGLFDVTVKKNDVVVDAGAWIGDFSAYAASKSADVYAFEPLQELFSLLEQTAALNKNGKIYPVKKGLADKSGYTDIFIPARNSGGGSILSKRMNEPVAANETIEITTLDKFVEEHNIQKIDFIKADIEGAEREMLKGAKNTLKKHCPKLIICAYHLPDDHEVLERIILEANPNYKIIHLRKKIFACVMQKNPSAGIR